MENVRNLGMFFGSNAQKLLTVFMEILVANNSLYADAPNTFKLQIIPLCDRRLDPVEKVRHPKKLQRNNDIQQ